MGFGGSCGESYGFAVDTKVSMDDSLQYKVHNSKGKVYYVITNKDFVIPFQIMNKVIFYVFLFRSFLWAFPFIF